MTTHARMRAYLTSIILTSMVKSGQGLTVAHIKHIDTYNVSYLIINNINAATGVKRSKKKYLSKASHL